MCLIPKRRIVMKNHRNLTIQVYKQLLLRLVLKQLATGGKMSGRTAGATPTSQSQGRILARNLDGNIELSYDIKHLIEQSLRAQGNVAGSSPSQLFPDLLPQTPETSPNSSQVVNVNNNVDLLNSSVNGIEELESMPHIVLETDQSGQAILFVKSDNNIEEDFEEQSIIDNFSVPPSPAPSTASSGKHSYKAKPASKRRQLVKGSSEYTQKRERNNVAVRKSRDKAKQRQKETEDKVKVLSTHNEDLQKKVDLLTKELNVLKGLFANVGAALPKEYKQYIAKAVNRT